MATLVFRVSAQYDEVIKLRNEISKLEAQLLKMDKRKSPGAVASMETQLASTRQQMMGLVTEAAKAGAVMERDFKNGIYNASQTVNNLSASITSQRGVIRQLQNDLTLLKEKYRETVKSGGDTTGMSEQIKAQTAKLREQKDVLFALTQQQAEARLSVKRLKDEYAAFKDESGETVKVNEKMYVSLTKVLGVIGGVSTLKNFVTELINVRGQFQQLEIAFTTMLKSKEKADKLMSELVDIAAKTPFDLQGVASSAKQMLAYGSSAENVGDELVMLGNVAAGVGSQLSEIAYLYGTLRTQGRAYAVDIRQFAGRGIPIYEELAKVLGVTKDEVSGLVTEGKVGFKEVEQSFKNMTSASGIYYNLMEEQSKSLTGQLSNLGDAWDTMLNEIGKDTQGIASSGISAVKGLIENYETVGKVLIGLIATYGTYRTALMLVTVATSKHTMDEIALTNARVAARKAQMLLNAAMLTNPYVAVATMVAGLVATMWALHDGTTEAEKAQERFNQRLEEQAKLADERKQKADQLLNVVKEETNTDYERNKALETLKQLYPQIFQQYDIELLKLADILSIKKQIAEIEENRSYQSDKEYYGNLVGKRYKIDEELDYRSKNYGNGQYKHVEFYGKTVNELRKEREAIQKELDLMYADLQKRSDAKWESVTPKEIKIVSIEKNIAELENEKKQLEDTINNSQNGPFSMNANPVNIAKLKSINDQLAKQREELGKLKDSDKDDQSVGVSKEIDDVTNKIKNLKQEISDLRSGKIQVEAGKTVESVIESKIKELQQAEKSLETLTGIKQTTRTSKKTKDFFITVPDEEVQLISPEEIEKNISMHREAMDQYLSEYGDYQQKRLAIADLYALKISQAETEGEKLSLQKQSEDAMKTFDFEEFKKFINFADVFGDLDAQTTASLRALRDKLGDYINEAAKDLRPEDLKELQDAFKNLDFKISDRDPFHELKSGLAEYKSAQEAVNKAQEDLNTVIAGGTVTVNEYDKATGKLVKKTLDQTQAEKNLNKALSERQVVLANLTKAANSLGSYGMEVVNAGNEVVDMLQSLGVEIPEAVLNTLEGVGQVMNGLASIDLTKPFSAITGTISVLTGIGKTIGGLFGLGGADYSGYEEMKSRYDNLISVWDTLISKKMEYIDIDYGVEAQKAADEAAKLVETQIQRQRQLANMLAGSGASIGSHSLGYRINDRMTQNDWTNLSDLVGQRVSGINDVLSLDADVIGKVLQDEKFVSVLTTVNSDFIEYIQNIEKYGEQLEEIAEKEKEVFTGISLDSFEDSFVDMLSDLDAKNEDFAENFEGYLQKAIFSSLVANQYKDRIKKLYDSWAKYGESGNQLTADEVQNLRNEYQDIVNDMLEQREQIMKDFGWDSSSSSSEQTASSRGFGTEMTHEDAGELSGRFTALQMTGEEIKIQNQQQTIAITELRGSITALTTQTQSMHDIADETRTILANSYMELQEIRENTGESAKYLKDIKADIAVVKQNTAKL